MGEIKIRNSLTSRGYLGLNPYIGNLGKYEVANINLGNNPLSKIEIVSALNSFNLAPCQYHYNYYNCLDKYYPKIYLGTIQGVGYHWNYDADSSRPNGQNWEEKSGSCYRNYNGIVTKFISMNDLYVLPNSLIDVVFPICLAPEIIKGFFFCLFSTLLKPDQFSA